ncbi:MAG: TetR/AcrR family transcriptional regulator [Aureispira sp.]
MKASHEPWIQQAYTIFAQEGPKGLQIERLAKLVGKSKSSFYHHFADIVTFTEVLLQYHYDRSVWIAEQERQCANVIPEMLDFILTIKTDLLFNRQLRIHRQEPDFRQCFEETNRLVGEAIVDIWAKELGLTHNSHLAGMVLTLSLENFYLQITEETLNYPWLEAYVQQLKKMVQEFGKTTKTVIK